MSDVLITVKENVLYDIKFEWIESLKLISLMDTCERVISLKNVKTDDKVIIHIKSFIESVNLLKKFESVRLLDEKVSENLLMIIATEICSLFTTNIDSIEDSLNYINTMMERVLSSYVVSTFESYPGEMLYDKFVKYLNLSIEGRKSFKVLHDIKSICDEVDKFRLFNFGTITTHMYGVFSKTPKVTVSSLALSRYDNVNDIINHISELMNYKFYSGAEIQIMAYKLVALLFIRECRKYMSINDLRNEVATYDRLPDYFREMVINVLNKY